MKEAKVCHTDAIKEAELCCTTAACILQQTYWENVLTLEHEAKAEEGWDCQAFIEAFGVALWACLPKTWGALMYHLELLTGDMLLAAILRMPATAAGSCSGQRTGASSLHSNCIRDASTTRGTKCWCHLSDMKQEEETVESDHTPEECLHRKSQDGRPVAKALKEPCCEAFSKESAVVKVARWAYFKTHWANFEEEGSHDLASIFWDMASSTNLLGTEVHEVQEEWSGQQELKATNKTAKASQKDIHIFRLVMPTELPKIMGLEGIHSSKALQWQSGLSFCLWCRKEGQKEGTMVNHLHYHMGFVCVCCLDFFAMSSDTMWQCALVCKSTTAGDSNSNWEESPEDDDNGDDDFLFRYDKD